MSVCWMALTLGGGAEVHRWNKYNAVQLLPSEYTPIEYLQSSGAQYIDTGIIAAPTTSVKLKAQFISNSSSGDEMLMAANDFIVFYHYQTHFHVYRGGAAVLLTADTNVHEIEYADKILTFDGNNYALESTGSAAINYYLFARNRNGSVGWYGSGRIYTCKIYDNDVLVRHFIPCINAAGAAGMYDSVHGVFYVNNGSGAFTAGVEIRNVAAGDFIEEVKSLNSNAYPDGGVKDGYYYEKVV